MRAIGFRRRAAHVSRFEIIVVVIDVPALVAVMVRSLVAVHRNVEPGAELSLVRLNVLHVQLGGKRFG